MAFGGQLASNTSAIFAASILPTFCFFNHDVIDQGSIDLSKALN
jgi:hypothetical protein